MTTRATACFIVLSMLWSGAFCVERKVLIRLNEIDALYTTDDRFFSLGMDSNLIRDRWETFNFSSKRLKTLAKGLSPAFLRLMGTDGDRIEFVRNITESKLNGWPFPHTTFYFSAQDWDNINKY